MYIICYVMYIMLCYKLCIYVKICKLLNWQSIIKLKLIVCLAFGLTFQDSLIVNLLIKRMTKILGFQDTDRAYYQIDDQLY